MPNSVVARSDALNVAQRKAVVDALPAETSNGARAALLTNRPRTAVQREDTETGGGTATATTTPETGAAEMTTTTQTPAEGAATETPVPEAVAPVAKKKSMLMKDASLKILQDAFKDVKADISAGKVEVYAQADFQAKWDEIYGSGAYAWDTYVVPKFGNLEGFAHEGTNYINSDTGSIDVVPHEMLHNNAHANWYPPVGMNINEGMTEWLTIKAVTAAGHTPSHSYPNQEAVIQDLIAVVGEDLVIKAYFNGTLEALKTAVDSKTKGGWATFKTHMDAEEWTKAKAALVAK